MSDRYVKVNVSAAREGVREAIDVHSWSERGSLNPTEARALADDLVAGAASSTSSAPPRQSERSPTMSTEPDQPGTAVATALERQDFALAKRADRLAKAGGLLPTALKDKPAEVYLILVKAQGLGIPDGEALANLYPIEGKLVPSAQLQAALIRRANHKLQVIELGREKCVMRARRREDPPDQWVTVDYTIEDARDSGLLDQWVERKYRNEGDRYDRTEKLVVGDDTGIWTSAQRQERGLAELPEWAVAKLAQGGNVRRKDNWWKFRRDMLRARCIAFIGRSVFSDCLLGIGGAIDWTDEMVERAETRWAAHARNEPEPEWPEPPGRNEDIVDADIVHDENADPSGGGEPATEDEQTPGPAAEGESAPDQAPDGDEPVGETSTTPQGRTRTKKAATDEQPPLEYAPGEEPFTE